jgi:hypothetical protein
VLAAASLAIVNATRGVPPSKEHLYNGEEVRPCSRGAACPAQLCAGF